MEIQIKNFITAVAGIAMKKLHIFVKKRVVQEVTIRYNNPKTLEVLKGLAKYFDFVISRLKKTAERKEIFIINGVTILKGKGEVNNAEMNEIFSASSMNSKDLRGKWDCSD